MNVSHGVEAVEMRRAPLAVGGSVSICSVISALPCHRLNLAHRSLAVTPFLGSLASHGVLNKSYHTALDLGGLRSQYSQQINRDPATVTIVLL
jgi:hypothetical protein